MPERVAVVGASPKTWRYSNRAIRMLQAHGHTPVPVSPSGQDVEGLPGFRTLRDIRDAIDTVTLYVSAERQAAIAEDLLVVKPRRVIFNPGAENPALEQRLREAGVEVVEECTLVMLATGEF